MYDLLVSILSDKLYTGLFQDFFSIPVAWERLFVSTNCGKQPSYPLVMKSK